jgi:hypothetical protein
MSGRIRPVDTDCGGFEMKRESMKIESKDLSIEDLYKDFYNV